MKLYYYKHPTGNVGDDLNPWLWEKLLPGIFSGYRFHGKKHDDPNDNEPIFIGIGTLLNELVPNQCKIAVIGAGTGYGTATRNESAKYYAVRGPMTAKKLGLEPATAVTDGAALIATVVKANAIKKHRVSIFPHHGSSEESNRWQALAKQLAFNYIDPAWQPNTVIGEILASELILTEAMHGAILADTLRVPWIPYLTSNGNHEFKWMDWCASLNIPFEPIRIYPLYKRTNIPDEIKNYIRQQLNCDKLRKIVKLNKVYLSSDHLLKEKVQILEDKVGDFKVDFLAGRFD